MQNIIDLLLSNRIPPSWVDHAYTYGVNFLNHSYHSPTVVELVETTDNEHLVRLQHYPVPPAIPEWNGWHHPELPDLKRIWTLDAIRVANARLGYDPRQERGWTQVGDDGLSHSLPERPLARVQEYANQHPVEWPPRPALSTPLRLTATAGDNLPVEGPVDNNTSTEGPVPMEVVVDRAPTAPAEEGEVVVTQPDRHSAPPS